MEPRAVQAVKRILLLVIRTDFLGQAKNLCCSVSCFYVYVVVETQDQERFRAILCLVRPPAFQQREI